LTGGKEIRGRVFTEERGGRREGDVRVGNKEASFSGGREGEEGLILLLLGRKKGEEEGGGACNRCPNGGGSNGKRFS